MDGPPAHDRELTGGAAPAGTAVVTGAYSFIGRFIAIELLHRGWQVRTVTNRPRPIVDYAGWEEVAASPLDLASPESMRPSLIGADVLFNTYWVRFPHAGVGFDDAIANTRRVLEVAREAGVRRVVHVSVSNPSLDSDLDYYRGKAEVERIVAESGLEHAIVRPTLVFGDGDILLNNIAWLLRRFPWFAVPGDGRYRVQPVSGRDTARVCVDAVHGDDGAIVDAAGPDVMTFDEMVLLVARAVGRSVRLVHTPPRLALALSRLIGIPLRDVMLTWQEIGGLQQELLVSHEAPLGTDRLADWLAGLGGQLGSGYSHELRRHFG